MSTKQYKAHFYRQGARIAFKSTPLKVNWKLTNMCNYACSYCFGQFKLDKQRFSTWEQMQIAVENLAKLNRSSYNITLSGGEPTIHPHFLDLMDEMINKLGHKPLKFTIISNGARHANFYEKMSVLAKNTYISLHISIHSEFANLEHLKELIIALADITTIKLSCMFNYKKFETVKAIYEELTKLREQYVFKLDLVKLRTPPKFIDLDPNYTTEHLVWQKQAEQDLAKAVSKCPKQNKLKPPFASVIFYEQINEQGVTRIKKPAAAHHQMGKGFRNFCSMYCSTGTSVVRIHPNGQLNGAMCSLSRINSKNIFDENFYIDNDFMTLVRCNRVNCGCGSDLDIPKFADKDMAQKFLEEFKHKHVQCLALSESKNCNSSLLQSFIKSLHLRWKLRRVL